MNAAMRIHPADTVAVALRPLSRGEAVTAGGIAVTLENDIPAGHKFCLLPLAEGAKVIKYGFPIGYATRAVRVGEHVHTHNLRTALRVREDYTYSPAPRHMPPAPPAHFLGFRRPDGRVGVRNEIWIVPTVGCVNGAAEEIARQASAFVSDGLEGVYAFRHTHGCAQLGEDLALTQKALAGLIRHPNAAGVLVLGLGCEFNNIAAFRAATGDYDERRVRFLECQSCGDEIAEGLALVKELANEAKRLRREEIPASELVIGLKCGGSDGFSGITGNPLLGAFSDLLLAQGGATILTEVPEMFGAETVLMNRCKDRETFEKAVRLIDDFKAYFVEAGQPIYENPAPGNREGGISTLDEKSLGCLQKGGGGTVTDVLLYGEPVRKKGLNLLQAPGYDLVSASALAVSGAHIVLFTTGRGTPFSVPAPTLKVATNSALAEKKANWIDFNAGALLEGVPMETLRDAFFQLVLDTASGKKTKAETHGLRELAIFKTGVTV